jgi:DNA polymerase III epsilon subunit-like protein
MEKSMNYLYFDTETSGKVEWKRPANDPRQPKIVQFAGILADETGYEINSSRFIVHPGDMIIPDEAAQVHGITTEFARTYGVSPELVFSIWSALLKKADVVVAHNSDFDLKIMEILAYQLNVPFIAPKNVFCTMKKATNIVNLPPNPGFKTPKWPSLKECMQFFFNEEIVDAHDAMADARGCMRIHREILNRTSEEIF